VWLGFLFEGRSEMDGKQYWSENQDRVLRDGISAGDDIAEAFDAGLKIGQESDRFEPEDDVYRAPLQDRIEKLAGELAVAAETREEGRVVHVSMGEDPNVRIAATNAKRVAYYVSLAAAIIAEAERVSKATPDA
jgi:hypothetical protein